MTRVFASHEYTKLLGPEERIYVRNEKLDRELAPMLPNARDMRDELLAEVRRCSTKPVEFIERESLHGLYVEMGSNPSTRWAAHEPAPCYAIVQLGGRDVISATRHGNTDIVRSRILEACRLIGQRVAADVDAFRENILREALFRQAGVDADAVTVRASPQWFPAVIRDDDGIAALTSWTIDAALLLLRAWYFVAPPGPDPEPVTHWKQFYQR